MFNGSNMVDIGFFHKILNGISYVEIGSLCVKIQVSWLLLPCGFVIVQMYCPSVQGQCANLHLEGESECRVTCRGSTGSSWSGGHHFCSLSIGQPSEGLFQLQNLQVNVIYLCVQEKKICLWPACHTCYCSLFSWHLSVKIKQASELKFWLLILSVAIYWTPIVFKAHAWWQGGGVGWEVQEECDWKSPWRSWWGRKWQKLQERFRWAFWKFSSGVRWRIPW